METSISLLSIESHFSQREYHVLELIAEGLTNREIGEKLFISSRTAEGLRSALLVKTGSNNAAALVAFAFRNGILK